jgi:hypothetical protein
VAGPQNDGCLDAVFRWIALNRMGAGAGASGQFLFACGVGKDRARADVLLHQVLATSRQCLPPFIGSPLALFKRSAIATSRGWGVPLERFFRSLKEECIWLHNFGSFIEARVAIVQRRVILIRRLAIATRISFARYNLNSWPDTKGALPKNELLVKISLLE